MAAVNVALNGIVIDKYGRVISGPVKIVGELMYADRHVGGGPMPPGEGEPDDPVHIWGGGNVPMPNPPIANVPGAPGYRPPMPDQPPPGGGDKPPPESGGWGYVADWNSWGYFPATGEAQPKK